MESDDDQWPGADYRYLKVKGDDGNVYILRLDEPSGEWELTMFQRRQAKTLAKQVTREKRRPARWHVRAPT